MTATISQARTALAAALVMDGVQTNAFPPGSINVPALVITPAEGDAIKTEYSGALDENLVKAKTREAAKAEKRKAAAAADTTATDPFKGSTAVFQPAYTHTPVATAVSAATVCWSGTK